VSEKRLLTSAKAGVRDVPQSSRASETSAVCAKTNGAIEQINASNAKQRAVLCIFHPQAKCISSHAKTRIEARDVFVKRSSTDQAEMASGAEAADPGLACGPGGAPDFMAFENIEFPQPRQVE
jgi:lipid A disaccharide synthetase